MPSSVLCAEPQMTTIGFGGAEQHPHPCLPRNKGRDRDLPRKMAGAGAGAEREHSGNQPLWECSGTGGWWIPPLRGMGVGAQTWRRRQRYLVDPLGQKRPGQLAHQAIRDSKSRVPATCPRAHSSRVAPGSQSPQPIVQERSRPGCPLGREPRAASFGRPARASTGQRGLSLASLLSMEPSPFERGAKVIYPQGGQAVGGAGTWDRRGGRSGLTCFPPPGLGEADGEEPRTPVDGRAAG